MWRRFAKTSRRRFILSGIGASILLLALSIAWPLPEQDVAGPAAPVLRITDRNGILLREVRPAGRSNTVPLERISPVAIDGLIATEDRRFYDHFGIDIRAMLRAAWTNLRSGEVVSGGSTLTMQVARALRGRTSRGFFDKIAEMHLALRLEAHQSKREILALWLNRVPFGNQTVGIDAAARFYFGKPAADLTPGEATFLVGLPQNPTRLNPFRHPDRARMRRHTVLQALLRDGKTTTAAVRQIENTPLEIISPTSVFRAPHFVDRVLSSGVPPTAEIRTTLDYGLQQQVEELMRGHLNDLRGHNATNAAVVVLDNRSGDVLAYAGSADYWDEQALGQNDGVRMLRQPGSALKPFTYGLALSTRRYTPASIIPDLELQVLDAGAAFSPDNYDKKYHGPVPLRQALACSYNVPAVRVTQSLGPDALLRQLRQAGFTSLQREASHYGLGLTLGNGEVSLLELARAYSGLSRTGHLPTLRFTIDFPLPRLRGRARVGVPDPPFLSPDVATLITDILADPEARAPAFGRGGPLELPFPCAVKTGTSKDYRDNWAVGYTPRHTVAVWVGNFNGSPMHWISGVSGAGPLLKLIFLALGPAGTFPEARGVVRAPVCPSSGLRPGAACPGSRMELFLAGTAPTKTCDVHRVVRLDRRTGLLADHDTPAKALEQRLFTVYPAEYHAWMRENGLAFPPRVSRRTIPRATTAPAYSDLLRIQYPESGTVYQVDPVLRPEYQRVFLKGAADAGLFDVRWYVNGRPLAGDYRRANWPLRPGRHTLELRGLTAEGKALRSRPSTIVVLGVRSAAN